MKKSRIGIIGLGGIAQLVHLPVLSKLPNAEIVAVAEINKSRLKVVGDKFGIQKRYSDYGEMLKNENLDAVIIATPTNTHTQIALDCLNANKDVLIEKPMTRTLAEAKQIHAAAKKHKKNVMVGMNLRYRPDAMLLKSLIKSGELGDIFYIRCGWLRKQSSEQKWFLSKSQAGGGAIFDLGIVLFDLALWIMDFAPVKSVSVQKFHHNTKEVEDSAVGFIRFENSSVISFEVSWAFHSDIDSLNLSAYGTRGTAKLNPLRAYRRIESSQIDLTPAGAANVTSMYKKSYENELKHFIGVIQGNLPVFSTSDEALSRMTMLEAIYKSADTGKEIKL